MSTKTITEVSVSATRARRGLSALRMSANMVTELSNDLGVKLDEDTRKKITALRTTVMKFNDVVRALKDLTTIMRLISF